MVLARILIIAFTILGLGIQLIYGQAGTPAPLQITEFQISLDSTTKWSAMGSGGGMMGMGGMGGGGMSTTDVGRAEDQQLMIVLKCKNNGAKAASVIHWEARYTDLKDQLRELQVKTKKKIKAGKDEEIKEPFSVDVKQLPDEVKVGYRITKIEFEDKSTWENTEKDNFSFKLFKVKEK